VNLIAVWQGLPASVREPIRSGLVSFAFSVQTAGLVLIGAAAQAGDVGSPGDLLHYVHDHWWGVTIALILPTAYRARQGAIRASNTVQLAGGASAVVTPPKGT
jgi:hypothetical protein